MDRITSKQTNSLLPNMTAKGWIKQVKKFLRYFKDGLWKRRPRWTFKTVLTSLVCFRARLSFGIILFPRSLRRIYSSRLHGKSRIVFHTVTRWEFGKVSNFLRYVLKEILEKISWSTEAISQSLTVKIGEKDSKFDQTSTGCLAND